MAIFTGAGVALVTPFATDGSVNYSKLGELLDDQIENGTDAIIICGTTGESSTLSEEEHSEAVRFTCEYVNGRIPVIAGTGSNATYTAIDLSVKAQADGADALLIVTPYYNKATQKGLIEHYSQIAAKVDLPIIMYNVKSRTGCNINADTAAWLINHVDNIVGIKEASGDISQIAQIAHLTNGELELYSGNDDQTIPILSVGGRGVISVVSNVAPAKVHEMVMSYLDGDTKKAAKMQLDMLPLVDALFCEVNPIPVKTAMNLLGWDVGGLRMPMTPMEPQNVERLAQAMKDYGLKLA